MKIPGNTVGTTMPRTNYNQADPKKADYLVGRENIVGKEDLVSVTEEILAEAKASGEFNGEDGKDGTDGKDGVSCSHSWNGTTLTVTSASGTSSANLKGEKGDPYTLTEADKQSIVDSVIEALPTWEGGSY